MKSFSANINKIGGDALFGFFTLLFAVVIPINAAPQKEAFEYDALPFALSNIKEHIIPIDMDGDGLKDLLCSNGAAISIYFQHNEVEKQEIFDLGKPDITIELPGDAVGWDVDFAPAERSDSARTGKRVVAIVDGKILMTWSIRNRAFSAPAVLLENLPGYLPKGACPLNFIRDVNEDGLNDIIVPGNGKLHVYCQTDKGSYEGDIVIDTTRQHTSALSQGSNLGGRVGQEIMIPAMTIRDVNNDGHNDVISKTDKITEVFLGRKDGGFPSEPSYRIDLARMTTPPKELDLDTIDFSNLSSLLTREPRRVLQDLDGDKIEDLLVLDNDKITIYGGTSTGMDLSNPRQILKSGGNVLLAFAAVTQDANNNNFTEDEITASGEANSDKTRPKDLIIARIQDISIRDVFTWIYFSKSLDIDFFIYKKQGALFEKRPAGKATVTVKIPSVMKISKYVEDLENSEKKPANIRVVRATLRKTQSGKDRLVLKDNTIQGFQIDDDKEKIGFDQLNGNQFDEPVKLLENLGFKIKEGEHKTADLDEMIKNLAELGSYKLLAVKDIPPVFNIDIAPYVTSTNNEEPSGKQSIAAVDLNGDNLDDIFLFTNRDDTGVSGTLFLSR